MRNARAMRAHGKPKRMSEMKKNEAYYKCPHCKGPLKVVLDEDGTLRLLEHKEGS